MTKATETGETAETNGTSASEIAFSERQQIYDEWQKQWSELQERISAVWPVGLSAVDVISEMREPRVQGKLLGSEPEAQI